MDINKVAKTVGYVVAHEHHKTDYNEQEFERMALDLNKDELVAALTILKSCEKQIEEFVK